MCIYIYIFCNCGLILLHISKPLQILWTTYFLNFHLQYLQISHLFIKLFLLFYRTNQNKIKIKAAHFFKSLFFNISISQQEACIPIENLSLIFLIFYNLKWMSKLPQLKIFINKDIFRVYLMENISLSVFIMKAINWGAGY